MQVDLFTAFVLFVGAATLSVGFMYGILRFDAWLEGRKW